MPITKKPLNPVPSDYQPPNTLAYKVQTGDSLKSIAEANGLTWQQLALLNWKASNPDEINWYLYRNVGCRTASPDGHNYSFRSEDSPGLVYFPDNGAPLHGGGTPGHSTTPPSSPNPGSTPTGTPPEIGRVARNDVNILKLPITRLPVGWKIPMPTELTRFRIWVPTNTGGKLKVRHLGSGNVDLRKPLKTVIQKTAKEIVYDVKPGEFGEFFVVADGKPNDFVECTFVQVSVSRDGTADSDPPLLPWNFFFWPSALEIRQSDGSLKINPWSDRAADVMRRYGEAFGEDGGACQHAEKTAHGTPDVGAGWEGHCHNSAPASMLFEQPKAASYNGVDFDEEEMELLAAEFYGNFGRLGSDWWELKRGNSKPGGGRWYLPGFFKPGGPKTRADFIAALKKEGFTDASGPRSAETIADGYISGFGSEAAFSKQMQEWMGELAAEFYDKLIDLMRVKKHPLLSNMRSYSGSSGPEEVWNQGYFWYSAFYQENGDTHDEKDMIIICDLRSNIDQYPSTGFPAEVVGDEVKPKGDASLMFDVEWRIQFDASGKIVVNDTKNEWRHLKNSPDQGAHELFAPTNLHTLGKPDTARKSGTPFSLGNDFVSNKLLSSGLLKLHKRFS